MENFATILILLSLLGMFFALIGVIKGSIKFLRVKGRKNSIYVFIASVVLLIIGGSLFPVDNSQTALQTSGTQASTSITQDNNEQAKENVTEESADKENSEEKTSDEEVDNTEQTSSLAVSSEEDSSKQETTKTESTTVAVTPSPTTPKGKLTVHYIDVGQGASQLIQTPSGKTMLIDGGNNDDEQLMVSYLKKQGVTKVDVLIGTHPDADHVGGLDAVVDAFDIGTIYMPKVSSNTKTFESLLTSIKNKNLKVTTAKAGITIDLDDQLDINMIAPVKTYDDKNEMSAVVKLTFSKNSFLFTGDAESGSENDMISSGANLKSDVLLVGHHGSNSSTSQAFLNAVDPTYAVIQVGNNSYGHPTSNILKRLNDKNIKIYRNDLQGTIIFTSDGTSIKPSISEWKYTATTKQETTNSQNSDTTSSTKKEPAATTNNTNSTETNTNVYYKNCDAVRAAGKAPLYKGEPGYSTKLDRDKDGVACE